MPNQDIAVLAKKAVELSKLSATDLDKREWEAMLLVGAIYSAATPAGVDAAKMDIQARWGTQLQKAGFTALLHPTWHLRTDDGKPPAVQKALISALDNPARTLSGRLAALQAIPANERPPLTDLVRALAGDAFAGATGAAKVKYVDAMRAVSPKWMSDPWLTVLPRGNEGSAIQILLDDQGVGANDGSVFDKDASDDPFLTTAIQTWNVDALRDNPLAVAFQGLSDVADETLDTGAGILKGVGDVSHAVATMLKWAPYVLGGLAVAGVTTVVIVKIVGAVRE